MKLIYQPISVEKPLWYLIGSTNWMKWTSIASSIRIPSNMFRWYRFQPGMSEPKLKVLPQTPSIHIKLQVDSLGTLLDDAATAEEAVTAFLQCLAAYNMKWFGDCAGLWVQLRNTAAHQCHRSSLPASCARSSQEVSRWSNQCNPHQFYLDLFSHWESPLLQRPKVVFTDCSMKINWRTLAGFSCGESILHP